MTTTNYVWDVTSRLPVVLQDGENTYVYGLDLISATDSQGDQTYFLYDGLGSVTDVTDENGDVVASYSYDVFGAIRSQTGSSDNYWLFTGEQNDADSGMYYLRARFYDSETGRFVSRDPVPFVNRYAYVNNNPANLIDRSGLASEGFPGYFSYAGTVCLIAVPADGPAPAGDAVCLVIGGTIIVGGLCVAFCDDIFDGLGNLFSSGKSDKARLSSVKKLSSRLHEHLCAPYAHDRQAQREIRNFAQNIRHEYDRMGPTYQRQAEDIFRDIVWENPCGRPPTDLLFPYLPMEFRDD